MSKKRKMQKWLVEGRKGTDPFEADRIRFFIKAEDIKTAYKEGKREVESILGEKARICISQYGGLRIEDKNALGQ